MFKLWGKIIRKHSILEDYVFQVEEGDLSFEDLLAQGISELCNRFDIENPMWLSDNTRDILNIKKTSFLAHHFIEEIPFDYFEIELLE